MVQWMELLLGKEVRGDFIEVGWEDEREDRKEGVSEQQLPV